MHGATCMSTSLMLIFIYKFHNNYYNKSVLYFINTQSTLPTNTPSQITTTANPPRSLPTTMVIEDTIEPGYQVINIPKPTTNQNPPPISIQPIGMYAEINAPEITSLRRPSETLPPARSDSQTQSHSDSQTRSEPRSSPIDQHTTGSSGGHDHDGNSDDDTSKPVVYAQVDMEMKRASRKQKEQINKYKEEILIGGQQHEPPSQTEDSWV